MPRTKSPLSGKRQSVGASNGAMTVSDEAINARVLWLYYMADQTQQDIADVLQITRLRVNKIIGQARADGLVHIEIRAPLIDCIRQEEALKVRFGLHDARVVPHLNDENVLQRTIGEAAAQLLDGLLQPGQAIGVGWGRTLVYAGRRLTPRALADSSVVGLMGGLTRGSDTNTFEVSAAFSQALGAECFYMTAPVYCPSAASRDALRSHYGLAEVLRRAHQVDIAIVSCGDLSDRSQLSRTVIVKEHLPSLQAKGTAGDLLGTFLDTEGQPVAHELNDRVMSVVPADLRAIPTSILASGGLHKQAIIKGILKAGYVNHLVTDEAVATALLND